MESTGTYSSIRTRIKPKVAAGTLFVRTLLLGAGFTLADPAASTKSGKIDKELEKLSGWHVGSPIAHKHISDRKRDDHA